MLHFILIFKNCFDNFTIKQKSIFFIADINIDLSLINFKIYKYNSDLDIVLPLATKYVNLLESTLLFDTQACITFVNIANKIEIVRKKAANREEKIIFEVQAKEMVKFLRNVKFSLCKFMLNCWYIL